MNEEPPAQEVLVQKSNARRESRASANVKLSAKPSPRKSPAKKRR